MLFFDRFRRSRPPLIQQSFDDVQLMLEVSHEMFLAATATLLENEILDINLKEKDAIINRKEQEVRRAVLDHLQSAPGWELELSLVLLCIIQEAERLGDLCKTLAETSNMAHKVRVGPNVAPLRILRDRVVTMFEQTRSCFAEEDLQLARAVMEHNAIMKTQSADYLKALAHTMEVSANEAVLYSLAARMIGRTASHLSNIASSIALPFDQLRRAPTWT